MHAKYFAIFMSCNPRIFRTQLQKCKILGVKIQYSKLGSFLRYVYYFVLTLSEITSAANSTGVISGA